MVEMLPCIKPVYIPQYRTSNSQPKAALPFQPLLRLHALSFMVIDGHPFLFPWSHYYHFLSLSLTSQLFFHYTDAILPIAALGTWFSSLDLAIVVSFALLHELLGRALIMFQALHLADKPDFLPLWVKQPRRYWYLTSFLGVIDGSSPLILDMKKNNHNYQAMLKIILPK